MIVTGPLAGLKVIEFSQIMAGATCGMLLADMGADVIKVELIPEGNGMRAGGESAPLMAMNRNKRSIAVNLRTEGGREVIEHLVTGADVLSEDCRKGAMEELGIGYDALKRLNPKLIYCAITGEPGRAPITAGSPDTDINAGILAALGVVCAYVHRLNTGQGQMVDTSLMGAGLAIKFAAGGIRHPAPLSGEHTREILVELGYEDGDIAALVKGRAVAVA